MKINIFPQHIFWNYKSDADLDTKIITRRVILYGDIPEIQLLFEKVDLATIKAVLEETEESGRFKKRVNFIRKIYIDD
ncbi:MAG: hypothetical protein K9N40_12345 [Candidatus Cloacimonetes bacterium]|nr:hypothetical protein [Candidatus Cloacimonadota bacterium]